MSNKAEKKIEGNPGGVSVDRNIDSDRLSSNQKASIDWKSKEFREASTVGFAGGSMLVPLPKLNSTGNELVIQTDQSNAQIVITRDRPSSIFSGYGGQGHQKCSTIDIVAGRISSMAQTSFTTSDGEEVQTMVDPNFELDAARIYISEKTDIDENFRLRVQDTGENPFTSVPESVGRSAIGMKADSVRIIGNEGVKIVTGVYEFNSRGGKATRAGIELVAGNANVAPFEVQPFVKGNSLVGAMHDLYEEVYRLNALLTDFITYQQSQNILFSEHDHNSPGTLTPTGPPALGLPDPFRESYKMTSRSINKVSKKLDIQFKNLIRWEKVWLSPESSNWILSRFNGTN